VRYRPHFNHRGVPCHCPWGAAGPGNEFVGSVKEASKLDWLRDREDLQDEEGQAHVQHLERSFSTADKLLPWITREWKKGRLRKPNNHDAFEYMENGESLPEEVERGFNRHPNMKFLTGQEAALAQTALEEMKKRNKGVDIMQHKVHELMPKVKEFLDWQEAQKRQDFGEVAHRFDDGWTVRQLRNLEEAEDEGNLMGHCVGSHHGARVDNGSDLIYSLRDHRNLPHATIQLSPDHYEHRETGEQLEPYDWSMLPEDEDTHRSDHKQAYVPRVGGSSTTEQFYGKEDSAPKQEYIDRMQEWLDNHGVHAEPSAREFEPWWNEYYHADPIDHPVNYLNDDYDPYTPEEYNNACYDAQEEGLDHPELVTYAPDFPAILNHLEEGVRGSYYNGQRYVQSDSSGYDKELAKHVFNHARESGHGEDLRDALEEHENDFHRDVDNDKDYDHLSGWDRYNAMKRDYQNYGDYQLLSHLGPKVFGEGYDPLPKPQMNPDQTMLFQPNPQTGGSPAPGPWGRDNTWQQNIDYQQTRFRGGVPIPPGEENSTITVDRPLTHGLHGKVASSDLPPLYYRWSFSPEHGVELAHNGEDHPAQVRYHQDLVKSPGQTHGYAYRIGNGWRLTDWEHKPVEDPFAVAQVVRALTGKEGPQRGTQSPWEPAELDWDRTHFGLPVPHQSNL
jgi:hypothetical protein